MHLRKAYISFLYQKARMVWSREGDKNSAAYHAFIKARVRSNSILSILDEEGRRITDDKKVIEQFI